jgi:KAP family P-loop domain/TIR domain
MDIFLSYPGGSPEDSENVFILGGRLELFGLRTWIAERDSIPGSDYQEKIASALDSASVFAACVGSRPRGRWGLEELKRAASLAEQNPDYVLCTILLPGSNLDVEALPPIFRRQHMFDLRAGVTSVAPLVPLLWSRCVPERARLLGKVVASCRAGSNAVILFGPPASGKSMFARVVASTLASDYPDGHANIRFGQRRSAESVASLVLRYLRLPVGAEPLDILAEYRHRLASGRYLIAFDDFDEVGVDPAFLTSLVPPSPSTLMIVGRRDPGLSAEHPVFSIEPLERDEFGFGSGRQKLHDVQPGYISDEPGGEDLLNIQRSVDALCSVVAAKEVRPPLSIGLFGNWGAGKTFFIERMRSRIDALATASAAASESAFCSSIRQITFNAWHYSDTNLWASLASQVFEGLAVEDDAGQLLIEELASSRAQLKDANEKRALAGQRVEQARREEQQAREERVTIEISLSDLKVAGLEALDDAALIEPLLSQLNDDLRADEDKRITVAMVEDLWSTWGVIHQIWLRSKTLLIGISGLMVVMVAAVLIMPRWYTVALAAIAVVVAVARLISGPVRWVAKASRLARDRAGAQERKRDVELQSRLEQLRANERTAVSRVEEARRQVEAAERTIEEIKSGRRLFSFIQERATGSVYEPYLGIIALVRRDFQRLAELIEGHVKTADGGLPKLERIVLYIDDLDRCPSDRVVQVLEAVHLLMTSSLFVVVLAVDPRWLLRSLERHHQHQLDRVDSAGWAPTPQDYLEKIIQIPFSLPKLTGTGFERLIESFIPVQGSVSRRQTHDDHIERDIRAAAIRSSVGAVNQSDVAQVVPQEQEQNSINLDPAGLHVLPAERAFMVRLGGMIGTPRSTKRLTNLYRLVRTSLSPERLQVLLGQSAQQPEFPCVQILVAVVIGSPSLVSSLFAAIATTSGDATWWDLVDTWMPGVDNAAVWQRARRGMDGFRLEPLPSIASFANWVPDAMRYSYDTIFPDLDGG